MTDQQRPGEIAAATDPAAMAGDARLVFIGRVRTPWHDRSDCPKNLRIARERGQPAHIEIDTPWRPGLRDLAAGDGIILLTWLHAARRDLIVQVPTNSGPKGVFSLRSPVRPNPLGIHTVRILGVDAATGWIEVEALDCLDGTPVLDVKPWLPTIDILPGVDEDPSRQRRDNAVDNRRPESS